MVDNNRVSGVRSGVDPKFAENKIKEITERQKELRGLGFSDRIEGQVPGDLAKILLSICQAIGKNPEKDVMGGELSCNG